MLQRDFTYSFTRSFVQLTATVAPYSWMYPGRGLGIVVTLNQGGEVILRRNNLSLDTATVENVQEMIKDVNVIHCSKCGAPAFDPTTVETNRNGLCEQCFIDALTNECKKAEETEAKMIRRRDAQFKKKGYTHKVIAWVHPDRGDDYQMDIYYREQPTATLVQHELKKRQSRITTDYTIVSL